MRKPRVLDLNDAVQHPGRHATFDVEVDLDEEEDIDLLEPIRGSLDAVSTGNRLIVTGDFRARLIMECSRCLASVPVDVEVGLEEEFPVVGTPAGYGSGEYAEVREEDEPSPLFEGNHLRYEDLIRQNLWLNMPLRPLCREDCKGIEGVGEEEHHGRPEFEALGTLLDEGEKP
jgi:uncharacterized protein